MCDSRDMAICSNSLEQAYSGIGGGSDSKVVRLKSR